MPACHSTIFTVRLQPWHGAQLSTDWHCMVASWPVLAPALLTIPALNTPAHSALRASALKSDILTHDGYFSRRVNLTPLIYHDKVTPANKQTWEWQWCHPSIEMLSITSSYVRIVGAYLSKSQHIKTFLSAPVIDSNNTGRICPGINCWELWRESFMKTIKYTMKILTQS